MMAAYLGTAVRTARKAHACYWCHEPIVVGESFRESRQADDGHIYIFRLHRECEEVEARVRADGRQLFNEEPTCLETDIDGGQHERGHGCSECSPHPSPQPEQRATGE